MTAGAYIHIIYTHLYTHVYTLYTAYIYLSTDGYRVMCSVLWHLQLDPQWWSGHRLPSIHCTRAYTRHACIRTHSYVLIGLHMRARACTVCTQAQADAHTYVHIHGYGHGALNTRRTSRKATSKDLRVWNSLRSTRSRTSRRQVWETRGSTQWGVRQWSKVLNNNNNNNNKEQRTL